MLNKFRKLIKSEKGAIEAVAWNIILSFLVLGILATVGITLFRNAMNTIALASDKQSSVSKVKDSDILPSLTKTQVIGGDVISIIRYYATDNTVTISVNKGGGQVHNYVAEQYNSTVFNIEKSKTFSTAYTYNAAGNKITNVTYVQIN